MRTFRFIHCADLHIDSPFKGLARVDKDAAAVCHEATFRASAAIVDIALEQRVDFVTVGGDIYDSNQRSLRAAVFFRDQMARLTREGIPVFLVAGNHDPLDSMINSLQFPEGVHLFGSEPGCVPVVRDGIELARIYGISYPHAVVEENLALRLKADSKAPFTLGLLHCNVAGQKGHENYAPCTLEDLANSGMHAWCLGHVHAFGVLSRSRPLVLYPGCAQGRHINEPGSRGCTLVSVDETGSISARFLPVHQVRWERVEVDISDLEDVDGLLEKVEECLYSASSADWPENLLVMRLQWRGRGPLHRWLSRQKTEDLRATLHDRVAGSRPAMCIESMEDATRPLTDRDGLMQQESFVGDFVRLIEEAKKGGPAHDAVLKALSELFRKPLCRRFLIDGQVSDAVKGDPAAILALLDEAETLALDHLTEQ